MQESWELRPARWDGAGPWNTTPHPLDVASTRHTLVSVETRVWAYRDARRYRASRSRFSQGSLLSVSFAPSDIEAELLHSSLGATYAGYSHEIETFRRECKRACKARLRILVSLVIPCKNFWKLLYSRRCKSFCILENLKGAALPKPRLMNRNWRKFVWQRVCSCKGLSPASAVREVAYELCFLFQLRTQPQLSGVCE